MLATSEDYKQQLLDLLPKGPAWSREGTSTLVLFLHALADELARIHNRGLQLIEEADPRTTTELLIAHERVAGLPEPCIAPPTTLQARRLALVEKITRAGRADAQYFIMAAAEIGFTIAVSEVRPFRMGDKMGQAFFSTASQFSWVVSAPTQTVNEFRMAQSGMGDALRWWGNDILECVLNRIKPAHTLIIFQYGG